MITKTYALIVSCLLTVSTVSSSVLELKNKQVHIPEKLGDITLCHDNNGFFIKKGEEIIEVQNAYVDQELWNLTNNELKQLVGDGADIRVATQEEIDDIDWDEAVELDEETTELIREEVLKSMTSSYITVSQLNDDSYSLHLKHRLVGGGAFGAWAGVWLGKVGVHLVAQGLIFCVSGPVSLVATPAIGGMVHQAIFAAALPAIEATSIAVACAGGIAGAVATGPV